MRVKFIERREIQDEHRGTARATVFVAGAVHDLPEASALRWIARGVAVPAEGLAKPASRTDRLTPGVKA